MIGAWRIASPAEPAFRRTGEHAYYFARDGVLILSVRAATGITQLLLTWAEREGQLVIDQPSAPREERTAWLRASEHTMQMGGSWYVADPASAFDPDAPWWALVAAGAWHGIASAGPDPFIPFLMLDEAGGRKLIRLVTSNIADAEREAEKYVAAASFERAVWVRDGRIVLERGKIDAVIVTRYERGGGKAATHGLPYRLVDGRAVIAGPFSTA
jgi:hypothetical protein